MAANEARLQELEQRIGYAFKDRGLAREALTHGSALDADKGLRSYDRLEFLGDRVLGLVMAAKLHADFPDEGESGLAPRFNALVNRASCARAARRADLGPALKLGASEASQGGRGKEAILADVCESLIAAIYLDGGFDPARAFVLRYWADEFDAVKSLPRDPNTALQEWAAARKKALDYVQIDRSGPEHAPRFVIEARLEGLQPARGEGKTKRDAERAAAAALIAEAGLDA